MPAVSQNGPIRTGRGTCLERALRFGRREAPIRCGFARTYVPGEAACVSAPTRRPNRQGPFMARTPARPDGAILRAAAQDAGGRLSASACVVRRVASAAPWRMSASLTSISSRPKARIDSSRIAAPATIVGARSGWRPVDLAALVDGERGELGQRSARSAPRLEPVAVDPLGVVGVELLVDRGERGGRAGHGDAVLDVARGPRPARRSADRRGPSSAQRGQLLVVRRVAVQVALGVAHRAHAGRDVEVGVAARRARPRTRCCRRRCRSRASAVAGRAPAVAPRKVSRASSSPEIVRASMPKRSCELVAERRAVLGVAHGAGGDGDDLASAPRRSIDLAVARRAPQRPAPSPRRRAGRSRRRPRRGA